MTHLDSKAYGPLDIPDSRVLTLVRPILGFDDLERYALIDMHGLPGFYWFQSVDNKNVALIVTRPDKIMEGEYIVQIHEQEDIFKDMKLISRENLTVYLIVNVTPDPKLMTVNMMGPIIVNSATLIGAQVLSTKYTDTRHPVFNNLSK
ncbi:MAG: hypothetical protein A2Y33_14440 [Spirochaetes bacterium GWF1_51_8]|nr:MAG: hypothetical protein A2Y33_14440 [Spirochaetes bacterium GWF1_51_8]